jgi:hypothetical protein
MLHVFSTNLVKVEKVWPAHIPERPLFWDGGSTSHFWDSPSFASETMLVHELNVPTELPAKWRMLRQNVQRSELFNFLIVWFPNWISNAYDAHDDDEIEQVMIRSWQIYINYKLKKLSKLYVMVNIWFWTVC